MANPPVLGPITREDKLFLQAILLQTMPKTVVQYGHLLGVSAEAMLEVLAPDSTLVSFDINPACPRATDQRCWLFIQDQKSTDNLPSAIDFCFLDASHGLEDNIVTFNNVWGRLAPFGIIAIHDTGVWPENPYPGYTQGVQLETCYAHHPEEHQFVNWVYSQVPQSNIISFRTLRAFRHGFTLVQKYHSL